LLTQVEWLLRHVVPHIGELGSEAQVMILDRLLPLLEIEQANSHPGFVPVEVAGGGTLLKPPCLLLDAHDFSIQEVFGIGEACAPPLPRHSRLHFPVGTLTSTVRAQLRRLGMRRSSNDAICLVFLIQELKSRNRDVPGDRYGELQRGLMQRIVESWPNISTEAQDALLSETFVDVSPAADGGEEPDGLFALKPFRDHCVGRLLSLGELVSRSDPVDPFLCWTSLPLCPRGFPAFPGYRRVRLEDVVAHARHLGDLADVGSLPCHLWVEFKERVVAHLCTFLAECEPCKSALAQEPILSGDAASEHSSLRASSTNRLFSQLRKAKFLVVPMDTTSGVGPHTFVAPWRISLVLKDHRPPMFALPEYLQEHVPLLRLLGVRNALELPAGDAAMQGDGDAARAMQESMLWLFGNGAESFADVTVRCDGGSLFLHRSILMARSEYFRAMFQGGAGGFREGQAGGADIHLLETPVEVARVLFGYLYCGQVDEAPLEGPDGTSNSADLLRLSDELGVPHLFDFAQLWIANQADLEDCADALVLASRHGAQILERAVLSLLAANCDAPEVEQQLPRLSETHRQALQETVLAMRRPIRP